MQTGLGLASRIGREQLLTTDYLGERFTLRVAAVGYQPLYDPDNKLPRS